VLDPAINRHVVDINAALIKHCFQNPVADTIFAEPPHCLLDYLSTKVTPFEIAHAIASSCETPHTHRMPKFLQQSRSVYVGEPRSWGVVGRQRF
jgi:hypothetical protein